MRSAGWGRVCGLAEPAQIGIPWQVLADQPVGVLVAGPLPGLRGSQKYTGTPVSVVNRACSAVSLPWSQVTLQVASHDPVGDLGGPLLIESMLMSWPRPCGCRRPRG